jgi:hypothetical protein
MAADSYIQVATDGSGKKVRNLQLDVLQPDGTVATVQMQVVAIADERGRPVADQQSDILAALGRLTREVSLLRHAFQGWAKIRTAPDFKETY